MTKNILQDIVPPEKRSIRNIPVPNRKEKNPAITHEEVREKPVSEYSQFPNFKPKDIIEDEHHDETPKVYSYSENNINKSTFSKKAIWLACLGAILIVLFSFMSMFNGATVTVTPMQRVSSVPSDTLFKAVQGSSGEGVPYEVIKISKDLGQSVTASGEEKVENKSSGTIIIYNNVDKNPQRLIKNTRFETPEGLIYRINDSVVVPGQVNASTPGSIEVTVYADSAGEKFNIGLTDFTIPGFKNDSNRYKNIYARSKTEMSGGFIGTVKKIAESDLKRVKDELHQNLSSSITKDVASQVPSEFVLFSDAIFINFESLPQSDVKSDTVTVNERAVLTGLMFKRSTLSQYLASILVPELTAKVPPMISDIENLKFSMYNKSTFNVLTGTEISFNILGDVTFISQFDSDMFAKDIAGRSKKDFPLILKGYPSISKVNAAIRPFWKKTLPENVKNITIKTAVEK